MHRWDYFAKREAPSAVGAIRVAAKRSQTGNINIAGTQFSSLSAMFLPSQEGFFSVVEPGIRDLVLFIANELDIITYSSCEGHIYPQGRGPDVRYVGMLPRNPDELRLLLRSLEANISRWEMANAAMPVQAQLRSRDLIDRSARLPVLDLVLARRVGFSWESYFESLDACTTSLIELLREHRDEFAG